MGADQSAHKGNAQALQNKDLKSLSNLSPGYILKLKERFESGSEDYNLTKQGLKDFFKCRDSEVDVIFSMFDTDGNGSIDSYEFVCALSLMSHATLDQKAELIFNLYDFDRSQCISKDELSVLMTNALTALKNIEGKPSPTISEIEQKTNTFFEEADQDKNNQISLKEFKAYVTKDKQILEVLISFGIAHRSDLGTDFGPGNGSVPDIDHDLEQEINPYGIDNDARKNAIKNEEPNEFGEEDLGEGDQAIGGGPSGIINNSIPDSYKPSKRDGAAPDAQLQLDYCYGIRCHDTRNNLLYNIDGKLVYHCAGLGVVMDQKLNTQQHFLSHKDDVQCLSIDPTLQFCATGEIGPTPRISVWNTKTMEEIYTTTSPLTKGIKHAAFSKNGQYLACTDMSDDHAIAIFDVKTKLKAGQSWAPIATGNGTKAVIMSLGWNSTNDVVIATCVKSVVFFTFAGGKIAQKNGTGWGTTTCADTVLCQATCGNTTFTGHYSGEIISWAGTSISKRQKAHNAQVYCMYSNDAGTVLISGSQDGIISTWSVQGNIITKKKDFDLKLPELMSMNVAANSVCESKAGDALLVSTRGGEIFEFNQNTGKAVNHMRGHFNLELWGLAIHPTQPKVYTWGQDSMLAVWDLKTKRQEKHCKLESGGDAIAFSNSGKFLALGFINGTMLVLDSNFTAVSKRRDRGGKAIQCIKFSPNDEILAAGGHDMLIMTYNVLNGFKPMKKFHGHSTTIWQMDFSLDSQTLVSDALLFFDTQTGKQVTRGASQFKNEPWFSYTRPSGWGTQGIYPPCAMGNDINAVDRSPDGQVIATADDFGWVKLFKFPSPTPKAAFNKYTGHSSHVTNVMFTKNTTGDQFLVTTGGNDKCIFQWKYTLGNAVQAQQSEISDPLKQGFEIHEVAIEEEKNEFDEDDQGEGDQAMAVLPFLGQVKAMTPNGFVASKTAGKAPDVNLKLKWAHGFRSFDTRGNLKYTSEGKVVFSTAGVGVVQDTQKMTQEFFNLHHEDIVALAIHPDKDIIATGQMAGKELNESTVVRQTLAQAKGQQRGKDGKSTTQGKLVAIYIWRASTREVICKIIGFHRRAVRQLKFSPSGKKLLSVGEDDQHSVAIYDWANNVKICNSGVDPDQVYDAAWSQNETSFTTVGIKHIKQFSINGATCVGKMCTYSTTLANQEAPTCVQYVLKDVCLTGTSTGQIVPWNNGAIGKPFKAHTQAVWCIEKGKDQSSFYSGSHDGSVKIWNSQFQATKTFDIKSLITWQTECGLRSLDIKADGTLLIGTRGSDVLEVNEKGALVKKIVQGHYKGVPDLAEIWGCTVHPTEQLFASCGSDKTVRIWQENKMIAVSKQFQFDPTAADWSPDGKFIAIGDRNGDCTILDAKTLAVQGSVKSTLSGKKAAWVEAIRWSPDSTRVCFGTHGGLSKVEFVSVSPQGKPSNNGASKVAFSSALIGVDWSQDGNTLAVTSQSYELLFINTTSKQQTNASAVKETEWQTWSNKFGWMVQGIFPGVDFTDVNWVERSRNGQLLATGDDFGTVKLFKYPCVIQKACNNEYFGHSSHVTKVKFSANDRFVVSTGGGDMTVMIWETDIHEAEEQVQEIDEPIYEDDNQDDPSKETKVDLARQQREKAKADKKILVQQQVQQKLSSGGGNQFEEADQGAGDEFLAVIPWKGQCKPPTDFKRALKGANMPPNIQLQLEWVHGYKGDSTRNNLSYLYDGQLAYYIAAVGVVYNPESHTQRFFQEHTDDITTMAFHPDQKLVATGETGKKPKTYIWDTTTCKTVHCLTGVDIQEGIGCVAFSKTGKNLAIVSGTSCAVFDTASGACIALQTKLEGQCAWQDDQTFVLVGVKLYMVCTINAKSFIKKQGNFGGYDQRISGPVFNGNTCLTGAIDGSLYLWNEGIIIGAPKKLHARIIDAITVTETHIFTGARDSKITVMNKQYAILFTIDLTAITDSNSTQIRSITLNKRQDRMIIGTFGHEVIELPINLVKNDCQVAMAKILIHGHFAPKTSDTNEVWGLSIFSNQEKFATCSDDAKLKIWDTATRKLIKTIPLNLDKTGQIMPLDPVWKDLAVGAQGRALDISPKGDFIAVGMRDGALRVFQTSTWKMVHLQQCGKEWIEDLKFSPDGKYLCVGGHDNKLQVYSMPDCKLVGKKFGSSSSFITHIDWSLDSQNIRTNDGSYELLYYAVQTGKQITAGATQFRDEPWADHTCVLGWAVSGIWQACQDGSDINSCSRSHKPVVDNMQLIASADDKGCVNIYRYPSTVEKSKAVQGRAHSSHVTKCRFSPKDNYVFTTGGNDTAVMQWKILIPQ